MQFSSAGANGRNGGRPSKEKQPYIRPRATFVTPDQAEAWARAKAAPDRQEFEDSSELIAEARKRQEHRRG
jgi:hypothetical protein